MNFNAAYQLKEYLSTDSQAVGIALSYSTQSTSIRGLNMVQVALPTPNCTFTADVQTGVTQSALSIGKKILVAKSGNYMSFASTVMGEASRFSAIAQVVGPIDAATSRVEIAFNLEGVAFYSTSSATFAS